MDANVKQLELDPRRGGVELHTEWGNAFLDDRIEPVISMGVIAAEPSRVFVLRWGRWRARWSAL